MNEDRKRPVGRPRLGKIKLQFSFEPVFNQIINDLAKHHGISRSELIEKLLSAEFQRIRGRK